MLLEFYCTSIQNHFSVSEAEIYMKNHSFFSGKVNPKSMGIEYSECENGVEAFFTPKPEHISYFGVVHGGLMAAILDDAMAFCINNQGIKAYTAKKEIRYIKPLEVKVKYIVSAGIIKTRKKFIITSGKIVDNKGRIFIKSDAIFIPV